MAIIYMIAFVSTVGVGIVVPLFPFFGERVGASAEIITALMGVYAVGHRLFGLRFRRKGFLSRFLLAIRFG